jgi:branched-chain amino acid aminotransferase
MKGKIWVDGKFVDHDEAKVHVLSHSLQRGSTIFESIASHKTNEGACIFRLREHVERFFNSAKLIGMELPISKEDLEFAIKETVKVNGIEECSIRPLAFYPEEEATCVPHNEKVRVIIGIFAPLEKKGSVKVMISSFRKLHPNTIPIKAKVSSNYLTSMLASKEARRNGFDEALMLDYEGYIAECSTRNIFMVKNNVIRTPSGERILEGITRDSVIRMAKNLGYEVEEGKLRREDLYKANEVFITSSLVDILPVSQIDDEIIGNGKPGEITKRLRDEFSEIVHGRNEKYREWVTFVK